jgi:hypothetical protein
MTSHVLTREEIKVKLASILETFYVDTVKNEYTTSEGDEVTDLVKSIEELDREI